MQRMPPSDVAGVMLVNPPYGERIDAAGIAGSARAPARSSHEPVRAPHSEDSGAFMGAGGRQLALTEDGGAFFVQLAAHWKKNYAGWTAWLLTPDLKLPGKMRLKESRRVPMWNGPIECRLFRFDMVKGSARADASPARSAP